MEMEDNMTDPFSGFLSESAAMRKSVDRARVAARHSFPVLIQGEPGTGKLLLGRMIHQASTLSDGPWVVVDCATIPPDVLSARVFGHTKGALPGTDKAGKRPALVTAAGGTVWLADVARCGFR